MSASERIRRQRSSTVNCSALCAQGTEEAGDPPQGRGHRLAACVVGGYRQPGLAGMMGLAGDAVKEQRPAGDRLAVVIGSRQRPRRRRHVSELDQVPQDTVEGTGGTGVSVKTGHRPRPVVPEPYPHHHVGRITDEPGIDEFVSRPGLARTNIRAGNPRSAGLPVPFLTASRSIPFKALMSPARNNCALEFAMSPRDAARGTRDRNHRMGNSFAAAVRKHRICAGHLDQRHAAVPEREPQAGLHTGRLDTQPLHSVEQAPVSHPPIPEQVNRSGVDRMDQGNLQFHVSGRYTLPS